MVAQYDGTHGRTDRPSPGGDAADRRVPLRAPARSELSHANGARFMSITSDPALDPGGPAFYTAGHAIRCIAGAIAAVADRPHRAPQGLGFFRLASSIRHFRAGSSVVEHSTFNRLV